MMKKLFFPLFVLFGCWLPLCLSVAADNDSFSRQQETLAVEAWINTYADDLSMLSGEIALASESRLKELDARLKQMSAKFEFYCQSKQDYIAADDSLMELMARYNERHQQTADSVNIQIRRLELARAFDSAEHYLATQDTVYPQLQRRSLLLSQTAKTAPLLEKLKEQEAVRFAEVDKQILLARESITLNPSLKTRLNRLEEVYISIQKQSAQIQAAEFKPIVQRIKEHLMEIAAVGIILMFFNMVITKIQAAKKMRESAKKMQEMLKKTNSDYPQI